MKKRIILVTVAVVLAVVGTFAVYSYGKGADKRALAGTKSVSALVVTNRIPAGTTWTDAMSGKYFGPAELPRGQRPEQRADQHRQLGHQQRRGRALRHRARPVRAA